jgi:pyridoxamine 5'-phosphate oxidase
MTTSIADLRREYHQARLDETDVSHDPIVQFARWFAEAEEVKAHDANAMTLATATTGGAPSARIVLLKAFDERGFVFFTDYRSRKSAELDANPQAALVFYWAELERQIRITGAVQETTREESARYFASRPLGSRLGAWASQQSRVIPGRHVLEADLREVEERFGEGEVPLPPHWGGFRVLPDSIEFWQGRENRLHDRIRYARDAAGEWKVDRLSP